MAAVGVVSVAAAVAISPTGRSHRRVAAIQPPPTLARPTTSEPPTQPTVAATAPTTTTASTVGASTTRSSVRATRPVAASRPRPRPAGDLSPYRGLGTWVDVYSWSAAYSSGHPNVGPADVDRMAAAGAQTLYIEASSPKSDADVLEPDRLLPMIDRAHARGLRVVAWYLPSLEDPAHDLARMLTIARLPVEGFAVDIESRAVSDVGERNRRLVQVSAGLRQALAGRTIGAIVLPPVVTEVVNPAYWPGFPWRTIAPAYDVWLPMGYWTNRKADSPYRDAERYSRENVERLRSDLGQRDAPVHVIGGIGDKTTAGDVEGFLRAADGERVVGGSLYDWHTTAASRWPRLRSLRS